MGTIRTHRTRRLAALVATGALVLLAGCGGSSGGSDGSGATTSTAAPDGVGDATTTTATDSTTTTEAATTTTAADDGGGDLTGTWTADAGDILGANTANLGGTTIDCSGPVTLEFRDDGTFSQSSTATCTIAGQSATATIASSGDWSADGGELTVSNAQADGTMEILGRSQPFDGGGFADGAAQYAVDGDTLSITFTVPSVGTVTQTYTRS